MTWAFSARVPIPTGPGRARPEPSAASCATPASVRVSRAVRRPARPAAAESVPPARMNSGVRSARRSMRSCTSPWGRVAPAGSRRLPTAVAAGPADVPQGQVQDPVRPPARSQFDDDRLPGPVALEGQGPAGLRELGLNPSADAPAAQASMGASRGQISDQLGRPRAPREPALGLKLAGPAGGQGTDIWQGQCPAQGQRVGATPGPGRLP